MTEPIVTGAEQVIQATLDAIAAGGLPVLAGPAARRIAEALTDAGLLPEDGSSCGHCAEEGCHLEIRGYTPRKTRELILEHAGEGHAVMAHWRVMYPLEDPPGMTEQELGEALGLYPPEPA